MHDTYSILTSLLHLPGIEQARSRSVPYFVVFSLPSNVWRSMISLTNCFSRICPCLNFRDWERRGYETISSGTYLSSVPVSTNDTVVPLQRIKKGGGAALTTSSSDLAAVPVHPAIALPRYVMDEEVEVRAGVLWHNSRFFMLHQLISMVQSMIHVVRYNFFGVLLLVLCFRQSSRCRHHCLSPSGASHARFPLISRRDVITVGVAATFSVRLVRPESAPSCSTCCPILSAYVFAAETK